MSEFLWFVIGFAAGVAYLAAGARLSMKKDPGWWINQITQRYGLGKGR